MAKWMLAPRPRRWQAAALEAWSGEMRGVASVVTGAGKTVFAEMCMLRFIECHPGGQIVVVVPTQPLLDQWYVSLAEDMGVPESEIATYSGLGTPASPGRVNLMVINTARSQAPLVAGRGETFLVVDECHRAGSSENAAALRGYHRATLGLSATPRREYDEGFETRVEPALGPIIVEYDYQQARADGVIVPFDLVNVRVPMLQEEQERYDRLTRSIAVAWRTKAGDPDGSARITRLLRARATVSKTAAMRLPVATRLVGENSSQRVLVFHERIRSAEILQSNLQARGHRAAVYHSHLSYPLRRDNLRLYRKGVFDVLVTCQALDEGTNVPETQVAVIASSTSSSRQRIQRLGRVLRPSAGKDHAVVYTLYASDQEERRLVEESSSMHDIASVSWSRASLNVDG